MAFKMRSGNKVSFKNMGSSPAKDMKTGSYKQSFESPAKQKSEEIDHDPEAKKELQEKHTENERKREKRRKEIEEGMYNPVDPTEIKYNPHTKKSKSPAKQKKEKTYPEGYTEKDIKFLEEQREDVVRYEDLDEKGKEIWDKLRAKDKAKPNKAKDKALNEMLKKKSPAKQKYDLSKATVDGKHPQTEKNKKYEGMDKGDLFLQGKTRDKDGNIKDIQWAPNPMSPEQIKKSDEQTAKQYKEAGMIETKKSPTKQYDYSKSVWKNIKNQAKKDKASNIAKKDASILAGDTKDITSNQELKQRSKTRKQEQRSVDSPGGRRRTRPERTKETDTKLSEKLSQAEAMEARGEGKRGFSWKKAGMAVLEGQGLMGAARSGMGSGDYASTRIKAKQAKRAGKAKRKKIKATQRQARLDKTRKVSDLSTDIITGK